MFGGQEEFYDTLAVHFAKVMDDMDAGVLTKDVALDPARRPFLIAFSVWGERYLHLLLNYCFPSLLAAGNLPALCKERQPVLFIHTDAEGKNAIERAEATGRMKAMGVVIIYCAW